MLFTSTLLYFLFFIEKTVALVWFSIIIRKKSMLVDRETLNVTSREENKACHGAKRRGHKNANKLYE